MNQLIRGNIKRLGKGVSPVEMRNRRCENQISWWKDGNFETFWSFENQNWTIS